MSSKNIEILTLHWSADSSFDRCTSFRYQVNWWWVFDDILSHGDFCIVKFLDTFLAESEWDKENIVYVILNRFDMIEAKARSSDVVLMLNCVLIIQFDLKMNFNLVESYSRPDILYAASHHVSRLLYINTKTSKQLYDGEYQICDQRYFLNQIYQIDCHSARSRDFFLLLSNLLIK